MTQMCSKFGRPIFQMWCDVELIRKDTVTLTQACGVRPVDTVHNILL